MTRRGAFYRCPRCGKSLWRDSSAWWVQSHCTAGGMDCPVWLLRRGLPTILAVGPAWACILAALVLLLLSIFPVFYPWPW